MSENSGFWIDEDPLRAWILKAYHEEAVDENSANSDQNHGRVDLVEALRHLLSGPPEGPSSPGRYYFEDDPQQHVPPFLATLRAAHPELERAVCEPVLGAIEAQPAGKEAQFAPNLGVWLASLSGPIAIQAALDETMVSALLSAIVLIASRLGTETLREFFVPA